MPDCPTTWATINNIRGRKGVRYVVYRLAVAKVEIRGEGSPFSAWACSHDGRAHQMLMGVSIFDATVAFLFLNMYVRLINDQITVNTYSVTEDLHFVSEHFYELQGAGTLFANNQRCVPRLPYQERRNKSPAV